MGADVVAGAAAAYSPEALAAQQGGSAVLVQSIGGGGGAGGGTVNYESANKQSRRIAVSIGGSGGGGSDGGAAAADITGGGVAASGAGSRGVLVQSIGGNGGVGGSNHFSVKDGSAPDDALVVGIRGGAGVASNGGAARFGMSGSSAFVRTGSGMSSAPDEGAHLAGHGIVVQSIGGSGGSGGSGTTGKVSTTGDNGKALNLGIGATGAGGGTGAAANVYALNGSATPTAITGSATTTNWNSHGIRVQSIGGGDGDGGAGIDGDMTASDGRGGMALDLGMGGNAAAAGVAGDVSVTNSGALAFAGDSSRGIFAQSVGGGGNGGVGIAGYIASTDDKAGSTTKRYHIEAGLGAFGGAASRGGAVTVTNTGEIAMNEAATVASSNGAGIFAQSIGGGDGNAGIGISGRMSGTENTRGADIGLGGVGGDGGDVSVTNVGAVTVFGDAARGVAAQSVGGGGGNGALGIKGAEATGSSDDDGGDGKQGKAISFGLGRQGGDGSTGGTVTVTNSGEIATGTAAGAANRENSDAFAIFAQSIGGGGGARGAAGTASGSAIGSSGGAGAGGDQVFVGVFDAEVSTAGDYAHGVFAQRASGATGGQPQSTSLEVIVGCEAQPGCSSTAKVSATGLGGAGIIAQSGGYDAGQSDLFVRVDEGASVRGGLGDGETSAAIWLRDGASENILRNRGRIESANGADGTAIKYSGSGGATVFNTGTIKGNFLDDATASALLAGDAPSGSSSQEPRTQVINEAGGEIYMSGFSSFERMTNKGLIEVDQGDGGLGIASFGGFILNESGGDVAIDLGLTETGQLASEALVATRGTVSFQRGSSLSLSLLDGFRYEEGAEFNLLGGLDISFEGEDEEDFSYLDYIRGDFLDDSWEFSRSTLPIGSFPMLGLFIDEGSVPGRADARLEV